MAKTSLQGQQELKLKIDGMSADVRSKDASRIFLREAIKLRNAIRRETPVGATGRARRSPVARLLKATRTNPAPAIAAINRKIAPHYHLIEFGTQERFIDSGASRGVMPATPIFWPIIEARFQRTFNNVREGYKKLIEKRAKR